MQFDSSARALLLAVPLASLMGCGEVRPWERGTLAKPQMALEPYPVLRGAREHRFGSREAASGGAAAEGGGCGCY